MGDIDAGARRSGDAPYLIALGLLGLGFGLVPLARGELFYFWDNARMYFPQTVTLHDGLRAGRLPQWSFSAGGGYPMVGEGQAASFYPFRLLFAWLFPAHVAFMLEIAVYIALAGIMTYLFLREFKVRQLPCLLAGLTSMFGSFSVVSVKNIAHVRGLWLLPLVLMLAERFFTSPRRTVWVLVAGLAFGLQLLSGNPHFAIITAVASGLYVGFRSWHRSWAREESLRNSVRNAAPALGLWVLAALIGFGIGAVQMVPQLMHTAQSTRAGGMNADIAMSLSANLRHLGQLLLPFAYEQGVELADPDAWGGRDFNDVSYRGLYMGAVPVVLAVVAAWSRKRWPAPGWALVALAVAGTVLALGDQTPVYPALWSLPVFGSLRYPYRFLGVTALCIACLAGLGLAHLMDARPADPDGPSARRRMRDALPLVVVLGLALAGAAHLAVSPPPLLLRARDFEKGVLLSLATVAAACIMVFGTIIARGRVRQFLLVGLVVFTTADLWWFRVRSGYAPSIPVARVMTPPPVAEFLRRDASRFRIMSLELWETDAPRNENIFEFAQVHASSLWGIDSADPYESLMLRRYFMVHEALSYELLMTPGSASQLQGYVGALNVKYVIAPAQVEMDGWVKVHESARARTWQNPSALPRAWLVSDLIPERLEVRDDWIERARQRQGRYPDMVRDWSTRMAESMILDNILERPVDYSRSAVVAGSQLPSPGRADPMATVVEQPTLPDVIHYTVDTREPAFLVISSNYYPGWTATVNDVATPIHRTNWVMSGLLVPAGRSEVVLRFRTPGLRAGITVSLVTLLLTLGTLGALRRRGATGAAESGAGVRS